MLGDVRSCRGRRGRLGRGRGSGGRRPGGCLESREEEDVEQLRERAPGGKMERQRSI